MAPVFLAPHPALSRLPPPPHRTARCSTISALGAWRRQGRGWGCTLENGFFSGGKELKLLRMKSSPCVLQQREVVVAAGDM